MCFPLQKCGKTLTVTPEPTFSRRFRKRPEWSYPEGRNNITLDKNCFTLYSCSDKLSHYKTYDFRIFLIPNAFKDVRLKNTFNRCKVHQILLLTVDYAYFLVKLSERNVHTYDLFLARSFKTLVIEHKFLQESCKIFLLEMDHSFLQESWKISLLEIEHSFLQESCKKAIASKNLARIELFCKKLARSCKK